MSLFAGAECSTSKNPLSQFSQHSMNSGNSLNKQLADHTSSWSSNNIVSERNISQKDHQAMNQFLDSRSNAHSGSLNMMPLSQELAHIQRSVNGSGVTSSVSGWSKEFSGSQGSLSQPLVSQNSGSQNSLSHGVGNSFQPRYTSQLRFGPSMQMMGKQNLQQSSESVQQASSINWDDHFKDAEAQMSKEKIVELSDDVEVLLNDADAELKHNIEQTDFNQEFEDVWNKLKTSDFLNEQEDFADGLGNFGFTGMDSYKFDESNTNQFSQLPNPYEIGLQLMENGAKLSEAALAFEAAVQQNPKHIDAWLKLGEVQSANEKEIPGITAYNEALKLDPKNLTALMNSAIGFINECYDNAATTNLKSWILTKYPKSQAYFESWVEKPLENIEYTDKFQQLIDTFLNVIRSEPAARGDPDLQLGLGVLFYVCGSFNKTIDCFKTALKIDPNNEILWNRLGAALANSNRSEEAIEAYYKALQLKPSFVRARYNLGVSCSNIGCYNEAAQHLLAGLSLHKIDGVTGEDYKDGKLFNLSTNQSTSLLESLKRAFLAMDRTDLVEKVKPDMDLNQFRNEFEF